MECLVSEFKNIQQKKNLRLVGRNVYLVKIAPNSLGDARQDTCKDKECNLGTVAGY